MYTILTPTHEQEYITITTPQGPLKSKVVFILQHLSLEYWGCEWKDDKLLIIDTQSMTYDEKGYYVKYSKSLECTDLTNILSSALSDAFLDSQINYERLCLAELEKNEVIWENERLVRVYQDVMLLFKI